MAQAGGWTAGTLDSGFMYSDGNTASISVANIDHNIKAKEAKGFGATNATDVDVVKDETRTTLSIKSDLGNGLSVGLTNFRSGSIQLQGGASEFKSWVPDAEASVDTTAIMAAYSVNENIDVLFGLSNDRLSDTTVTTMNGTYNIQGGSANRAVLGASYAIPDIALRVSATYMPSTSLTVGSSFTETSLVATTNVPGVGTVPISSLTTYDTSYGDVASFGAKYGRTGVQSAVGGTLPLTDVDGNTAVFPPAPAGAILAGTVGDVADYDSKVGVPETLILDFQTGIAADTLLFGSVYHAKWGDAQIVSDTGSTATKISTKFEDSTKYTLGLGRKINDQLSISATYAQEDGTGALNSSPFTVSNGTKSIALGARYTQGNMTISGGVNMTEVGGVKITSNGKETGAFIAEYGTNRVTAFGLKIAFAF